MVSAKQWWFHYCAWHTFSKYIRSGNLNLSSCPCCNPDVSHHVTSPCTVAWQTAAGLPFHMGLNYITVDRTVINILTFSTLFGVGKSRLHNSCAGTLTHMRSDVKSLKRCNHSLPSNWNEVISEQQLINSVTDTYSQKKHAKLQYWTKTPAPRGIISQQLLKGESRGKGKGEKINVTSIKSA